ncbi:MAG: homoserine dehydrogenase, partial [Methanomicrobiales archaeon HGW-Methanomicrobiales-4]
MMMRIAVIGMGSVGQGILKAIAGKDIGLLVTGVADSRSGCIDPAGLNIPELISRKENEGICGDPLISAEAVVRTAPYDVLVEVTPTDAMTGEPATSFIHDAITRGCHVVTSNKGPVALHYHNLADLAR